MLLHKPLQTTGRTPAWKMWCAKFHRCMLRNWKRSLLRVCSAKVLGSNVAMRCGVRVRLFSRVQERLMELLLVLSRHICLACNQWRKPLPTYGLLAFQRVVIPPSFCASNLNAWALPLQYNFHSVVRVAMKKYWLPEQ